jgi:septum formation protein
VGEPRILLASASPRRSELLRQVGIAHAVRPVDVDESVRADEAPAAYVLRLAEAKAAALWRQLAPGERRPVLAADTTVALEGEIFGKPGSLADARTMLGRLSGRTHSVHTAIALLHAEGSAARVSSSTVTFRELTPAEIDWYWHTGEPADKAGGYAVQGRAAAFISHIAGSYSGIMGLPLFETWELLAPVLGLTAVEPGR